MQGEKGKNRSITMEESNENLTLTERFDYIFALEYSLLAMPTRMLNEHDFKVINISMAGKPSCYGPMWVQHLIQFGGFDTIIQVS